MDQKRIHERRLLTAQLLLIIVGILLGIFLLYEHYAGAAASQFCDITEQFDCGLLNTSPYAEVGGIFYFLHFDLNLPIAPWAIPLPVSLLGIIVFCGLLWATLYLLYDTRRTYARAVLWGVRTTLLLSALFAAYLLGVAAFILRTFCIFCLFWDAVIAAALVLSFVLRTPCKAKK